MKELIIHIGLSKCASSTLQNFFSLNLSDRRLDKEYCAISQNGSLLKGSKLREIAVNSPYKYCASTLDFNNDHLLKMSLEKMKSEFNDKSVIISNEGLSNEQVVTRKLAYTFDSIEVPIKIFAITRPPVDWFNAAWWQWGCWSEMSLEEFFQTNKHINMYANIMQWKKLNSVTEIAISDISQKPIESFLQFMGIDESSFTEKTINKSSSADLIRFLIKNKKRYNRTIHNPTIEFILNSLLSDNSKKPPFVASFRMAQQILNYNFKDNKNLLDVMNWSQVPISDLNREKYINYNCYSKNTEFNFSDFLQESYSNKFLIELINALISR